MGKSFARILLCVLCASVVESQAQDAAPKLTQPEFAKLHKDLTAAKEPWQSIPWHVSLLEARAKAVKENKPIYMLCRAGHPLGCV